jgi:hypothetical protein
VEHYIVKPVTAEALSQIVVTSRLGWALVPARPEATEPAPAG